MAFPESVVLALLERSGRHCCICRKFKGAGIRLHHIDTMAIEGRDAAENGIPLCQDCHDMVGGYSIAHPSGRKYRPSELRRLRDNWFAAFAKYGLEAATVSQVDADPPASLQQTVSGRSNIVIGRVGHDVVVTPRIIRSVRFTPGPQHISEETASRLKVLVDELAELENMTKKPAPNPYRTWWAKLNKHFQAATYRAIPCECGDEAILWLQQQKAILRSRLKRAAPEVWRNELYAAIHTRAKQVGLSKEDLYELARQRLALPRPIESLKELGERNLQRLHQIVFGLT